MMQKNYKYGKYNQTFNRKELRKAAQRRQEKFERQNIQAYNRYYDEKFAKEAEEWAITNKEDWKHHDLVEAKLAPQELSNKQKNRLLAK